MHLSLLHDCCLKATAGPSLKLHKEAMHDPPCILLSVLEVLLLCDTLRGETTKQLKTALGILHYSCLLSAQFKGPVHKRYLTNNVSSPNNDTIKLCSCMQFALVLSHSNYTSSIQVNISYQLIWKSRGGRVNNGSEGNEYRNCNFAFTLHRKGLIS